MNIIPSFFCFFLACFFCSCSDFLSPVESTPTPNEYEFNYWLLNHTYLFEDELVNLKPDGDSVQTLYKTLSDPYTRYVAPSKSPTIIQQLNTSIVEGDIGLEYIINPNEKHALYISRVYPKSPAAFANVPRYGNIISINGKEIIVPSDYSLYDSILDHTKEITLKVAYNSDTSDYKMKKTTIYAPTIFIDTLYGITFIKIREFKLNTIDNEKGTFGELKSYLDSTQKDTSIRILDLRDNPGGHVNQCLSMADLFVKTGTLSTKHWRTFAPDGKAKHNKSSTIAKPGDSGEEGKFMILVNKNSASCAEIFTAAVTELAPIPVIGETTFGKGIGQTTFNTIAGGLAIITNLEFLTPNGQSYHKKGVIPDYPCNTYTSTQECIFDAAVKEFGIKKTKSLSSPINYNIIRKAKSLGGAYIEAMN